MLTRRLRENVIVVIVAHYLLNAATIANDATSHTGTRPDAGPSCLGGSSRSREGVTGVDEPQVSVGIVAYNSAEFLPELLDSLLSQDVPPGALEVIVSDDASDDDTELVVARYRDRFACLEYHRNAVNLGITGNSNVVLDMCRGRFCIVMGADDTLRPNRISSGLDWFARHPRGILNSCGVEVFDHESGRILGQYHDVNFVQQRSIRKIASEPTQLPTSRFMFRRDRLDGLRYDPRTPVVSDWLFINEMLFLGDYGSTGQIGLRYRRHRDNATQSGVERAYLDDRLIALDIFLCNHPEMYGVCRRQRSRALANRGKRHLLTGDGKGAAKYAGYAIRESPLNPIAYGVAGLAISGPIGQTIARRYRRIKGSG